MVGIRPRNSRGMKDVTKEIVTSFQNPDRSSCVTPTKWSLMAEPIHARVVILKFEMPANNAKLVASMCLGVILAKIMAIGRKIKHWEMISSTTSRKKTNHMSERPQARFQRHTNTNWIGENRMVMRASMIMS